MNLDAVKGIYVPLITPVDAEENVNYEKLDFMIDRVINGGVSGILLFGSNGEFYMFDEQTMEEVLEHTLAYVNGRVPVLFGIGAIRTKTCVRLAKMAEAKGAFGISVLQPMFLKLTDDELYHHFTAVSQAVSDDYPVLLYNNPGRTGYNVPVHLVERLARECKNIVGMKDSSGDITQLQELIRVTKFKEFKVFGGKDTLVFASLCVGAAGGVCSIANVIPEMTCEIYNQYVAGNFEAAREAQYRINPVRVCQDRASFPVATKVMCNLLGLDVGPSVRPSLAAPETITATFHKEMGCAGIECKETIENVCRFDLLANDVKACTATLENLTEKGK